MGMVSLEQNNGSHVNTTIPCLICNVSLCYICHIHCINKKIIYYSNYSNKIDIYYVQFSVTFQYLHDMPGSTSHGGSGPGVGQGHPSCQFMSIWCLLLYNLYIVHLYIYIVT